MLVDFGSTYCFANSSFVYTYDLLILSVPPVELCSFDGLSNNLISEILLLSIHFPFGESMVQNLLTGYFFLFTFAGEPHIYLCCSQLSIGTLAVF